MASASWLRQGWPGPHGGRHGPAPDGGAPFCASSGAANRNRPPRTPLKQPWRPGRAVVPAARTYVLSNVYVLREAHPLPAVASQWTGGSGSDAHTVVPYNMRPNPPNRDQSIPYRNVGPQALDRLVRRSRAGPGVETVKSPVRGVSYAAESCHLHGYSACWVPCHPVAASHNIYQAARPRESMTMVASTSRIIVLFSLGLGQGIFFSITSEFRIERFVNLYRDPFGQ